ncbi:MAG: hypothetical protein HZT41_05005 [Dechloromonas sp.]|nr:MAG: hypothetical protein HZT41_05005 [Dechloromonas sp.]
MPEIAHHALIPVRAADVTRTLNKPAIAAIIGAVLLCVHRAGQRGP